MATQDNTQQDDFQLNDSDDVNPLHEMARDEKLDDDPAPSFSPPDGVIDRIDDTDPKTDTNIDSHEHYDEGIEGAAEADPPKNG